MSWIDLILAHLGPHYELVSEVSMWEIALIVVVRADYRRYITNVDVSRCNI